MKKLKRIMSLMLIMILVLTSCSPEPGTIPPEDDDVETPVSEEKTTYNAGTYTAIGDGRNGPIVVQAEFSNDAIESIKVISHKETYHVGDIPMKLYPDLIVENQSLGVDIVSGATISSVALLETVRQSVRDAGGNPSELNTPITTNEEPTTDATTDILVIGGGAAGMSAAASAASAGKNVILVEKLGFLGGTSIYSIEGYGASESLAHKALNTPATADDMYANYIKNNPKGVPEAFDVLAHKSGESADWLRSIGAPLTVASSGFSAATSREVGKLGEVITAALKAEIKKNDVDIRINTKAIDLIMENDVVAGAKVEGPSGEYNIKASAVIIATGGFGANNKMVAEYAPALEGYNFSSSIGATGDGQLMAEAVGAQLRDMDYIRVNFTYYTDGVKVYYMGSLPSTGAIFVNNDGERFINDQSGYGSGMAVVEQGGTGWMIFDQSLIDSIQDVRDYYNLGIFESAPTIEELAGKIEINKENLVNTVNTYVGYVEKGKDEEFGRAMLNMTFDEAPYYACKMTAHVQGTFGGIKTNTSAEVLASDDIVIPGLYAAGESASVGTYGANPMAVNVVFGRIAGENAASYVK